LQFSPDGETLAVTNKASGRMSLREARTGKKRTTLRLGGAVKAFSPDLKLLAEGIHISEEGDTALNLWLVNSGKLLGTLPTALGKETGLHAVVFSRDGKMLAAIDAKKMVHLWEIATRKKVHQCQCSHDPVTLTFTPSGRLLTLESEAAPGQLPLVVD